MSESKRVVTVDRGDIEEASELLDKIRTLYVMCAGLIPSDNMRTVQAALAWSKKAEASAEKLRASLETT